jgi:hypothetical protein
MAAIKFDRRRIMQPFEVQINGIKCDAEGCDYSDPSVAASEYESYLNRPCPKCGASLLTEKDLALVNLVMTTVNWSNAMIGEVPDDMEMMEIQLKMDGSGTFEIKE